MDPNLSLVKICLGDDVNEISSDKVEGSGYWNSPEYQDTTSSKGKEVTKEHSFYRMETNEVSERYIATCFVNGLEAYDGEINLSFDENLISNEFARKMMLNQEDPFEDDSEKMVKSPNNWDQLLEFNVDDVPKFREELPSFVCKMGKSNQNKKRSMENLSLLYQDMGASSSAGQHLTQEEASKEALAIRISQKFALLEEVRSVLETMAYHEKYKKVLDEIWKDKMELDGMVVKEEEESIKKRLEGRVNKNALADTGSDINTMPYRIYEQLGRVKMKKVDRGITMINHTQVEDMGILTNVLCQVGVTTLIAKFLILDIPIDRDAPIVVGRGFLCTIGGIVNTPERLFLTFHGFCHQTFRAVRSDVIKIEESDSDEEEEEEYEIKRNKFGAPIYGPNLLQI
ncbi:putative reverse transcriptase domain-containing protein [Tanacetum coccineum]